MSKIFSTKLDEKVLKALDNFCQRYHMKKSHLLEEIILEGIQKRLETMEFAESIMRGLEDERKGRMFKAAEVEQAMFGKKKRE